MMIFKGCRKKGDEQRKTLLNRENQEVGVFLARQKHLV